MGVHSPWGPSVSKRIIGCPGSFNLCKISGPSPPSFFAAEGTIAHLLASDYLLKPSKRTRPDRRIGQTFEEEGFEIKVDDEMVEAIEVYIVFVRGIIKRYDLAPHNIFIEKKVRIPGRRKNVDIFGTTDSLFKIPFSHFHVSDYKHGKGVLVEAKDNTQCMSYGLGAYFAMPEAERADFKFADLTIVQPRCSDGDGIDTHRVKRKRLLEFHQEYLDAIDLALEPDAPLVADKDWCRFCPATRICPAHKAMLAEELDVEFDDVKLPAEIKKELPRPHELTVQDIARIYAIAPVYDQWISAIKQYAFNLASSSPKKAAELAAVGLYLKKRRSNRRWVKNAKLIEETLEPILKGYLYKKQEKVSVAQAEKLIKKLEKGKGKKFAIDWKSLYEQPDNGYNLAFAKKGETPRAISVLNDDFGDLDVESLKSANIDYDEEDE